MTALNTVPPENEKNRNVRVVYRRLTTVSKQLAKRERNKMVHSCITRKVEKISNIDIFTKKAVPIATTLRTLQIANTENISYLLLV